MADAARSIDRDAGLILRELRTHAAVLGEYPYSRLPRAARAVRDVRRADSVPAFSVGGGTRGDRAVSISRVSDPERVRAFRVVRGALDRCDHRLRLAADSQLDHVAGHADRLCRRIADDARGRLEKFSARNPDGRRRAVSDRLLL